MHSLIKRLLASRLPNLLPGIKGVRGLGLRGFTKNATTVSAGVLGAQVIGAATIPFITRLYGTNAFGIFAVFSSAASILSFLLCLRLDAAVPLPASRRMALGLSQTAVLVIMILTVLMCIGIAMLYLMSGLELFGVAGPFLWSLGLAAPAASLRLVGTGWNVREREFRTLSISQIIAALVTCLAQLTGGFLGVGPLGLILGMALGWWIAAAMQFRTVIRTIQHRGAVTFRLMQRATRVYKQFIFWTMPSSVINSLGIQLMPIVVVALYGTRDGGLFFLAFRVVSLPMSLVGVGLGRVMWSEIARTQQTQPQRLLPLFLVVSFGTLILTAPGLLFLPFASEIFSFAFGHAWAEAGKLASVLFFSAWFGVFITPISNLPALGYNHWHAGWEFFQVVITLGLAGIAVLWHLPLLTFTIILTIGWCFTYLIQFMLNIIAIVRTTSGKRSLLT